MTRFDRALYDWAHRQGWRLGWLLAGFRVPPFERPSTEREARRFMRGLLAALVLFNFLLWFGPR